jgi:hypothetical protein
MKSENLRPKKAIRMRCEDCHNSIYTVTCDHEDCILWPFRRGFAPRGSGSKNKVIREYCLWCCNGQAKEVEFCPSTKCPLYTLRFGKTGRSENPWKNSGRASILVRDEIKPETGT